MDHHQRHIDARAPAAGPRPANAGDRRPATRAAVGALVPWLEAITALAALTGLATSCADEPSDAGAIEIAASSDAGAQDGVADGVAASDGAPADSGKTDSGKTDTGGGVACHPVKNDGCPSGQHCVWEGDTITCVDDGEHEAGEACDDGKGCKIGVCVGSQGGEARCSPHCTIGLTCASGICNQLENSKGKVCDMGGDNLIACDPLAQDCKTGGTACYSTPKGFGCLSTGSADVKESCTDDNGCKPGLACIGQSSTQPGQCYKMCRQGGGEPSCDSVTAACSKLLGSNTVGYCDG